jgi:hypothetical protein
MDLIRPHAFALVAAMRRPLQLPFTQISVTVPRGAVWRLDYIIVSYPRTVVAGAQTSPELTFNLVDTRGLTNNDRTRPLAFVDMTTPAGSGTRGPRIRAAQGWRIEYQPGEVVTMEVLGMAAGPVPATISVTYLGQKGWGRR